MEPSKFLVGGTWRSSSRTRPVVNPYNNEIVGEICQASSRDIDEAIRAASAGFQKTSQLQSYQRAEILSTISREIEASREKFSQLITAETGKPITFSRAEVDRSIFTFKHAAEEAKRLEGSVLPLDLAATSANRFGLVQRFPIGVVGAITPFNFPINLVAHKIAPCIAAGNSFVLKPSSNAPMTALLLGEVIMKSGFPGEALNILPCNGGEADQLVTDERISLISFTGSPAIGWPLKSKAGRKKVVLELGGNAAVVVDKGQEVSSTAKRIALGAFSNAGQSCIAVQRVYVHADLFERFLSEFIVISRSTKVGDPKDESTVVGPMIDEDAAKKVEGWIAEAVASGARLHCGGTRRRATLDPTVLTNVRPEMNVSCQEVFAPLTTIESFDRFEDAVEMVNCSDYGLQAGVFTNDFANVLHAYRTLEVGGVIINDYPTFRIDHMPYGGVKDSGFGREGIKYAIEEMTEPKLLVINQQ
ncbi:MAG TPA: aldehyde dehydrogenase [Bacteroidetes bacterium]|nr:aldehyde dehydrogenase [Bacteroidota bacterium]